MSLELHAENIVGRGRQGRDAWLREGKRQLEQHRWELSAIAGRTPAKQTGFALNAAVLKTGGPGQPVPRVRIPPPPLVVAIRLCEGDRGQSHPTARSPVPGR